jgi:hypothetical protein
MAQLASTVPVLEVLNLEALNLESAPFAGPEAARPDPASPVAKELHTLLAQHSKLTDDVARLRSHLKRSVQTQSSHRNPEKSPSGTYSVASLPLAISTQRQPNNRLRRSQLHEMFKRPQRWELERACRIALMEAADAVTIETIYDRIQKRGSLTFTGYRRPFRAIALAMNALVKRGEATLSVPASARRWRWAVERVPADHAGSLNGF